MIKHLVKNKRDVIVNGKIYTPNKDWVVSLPEEMRTKEIEPMENDAETKKSRGKRKKETEPIENDAETENQEGKEFDDIDD